MMIDDDDDDDGDDDDDDGDDGDCDGHDDHVHCFISAGKCVEAVGVVADGKRAPLLSAAQMNCPV